MDKLFAVCSNTIQSVNDDDIHKISSYSLINIFNVDRKKCIIMDKPQYLRGIELSNYIVLRPQLFSEDYKVDMEDHIDELIRRKNYLNSWKYKIFLKFGIFKFKSKNLHHLHYDNWRFENTNDIKCEICHSKLDIRNFDYKDNLQCKKCKTTYNTKIIKETQTLEISYDFNNNNYLKCPDCNLDIRMSVSDYYILKFNSKEVNCCFCNSKYKVEIVAHPDDEESFERMTTKLTKIRY